MNSFAFSLSVSILFGVMTLIALRRRVLREQLAVLWVTLSLVLVALSLTLPFHLLDHVAHGLGVKYGSDLVFVLAILFLAVLVFHLTVSLARLSAKFTRLVQEVAINQATNQQTAAGGLTEGSAPE